MSGYPSLQCCIVRVFSHNRCFYLHFSDYNLVDTVYFDYKISCGLWICTKIVANFNIVNEHGARWIWFYKFKISYRFRWCDRFLVTLLFLKAHYQWYNRGNARFSWLFCDNVLIIFIHPNATHWCFCNIQTFIPFIVLNAFYFNRGFDNLWNVTIKFFTITHCCG